MALGQLIEPELALGEKIVERLRDLAGEELEKIFVGRSDSKSGDDGESRTGGKGSGRYLTVEFLHPGEKGGAERTIGKIVGAARMSGMDAAEREHGLAVETSNAGFANLLNRIEPNHAKHIPIPAELLEQEGGISSRRGANHR